MKTMEKYSEMFAEFLANYIKAENGNKAAAVRARKASLAIEKALKEYRKTSVSNE